MLRNGASNEDKRLSNGIQERSDRMAQPSRLRFMFFLASANAERTFDSDIYE